MEPRIVEIPPRHLVGMRLSNSIANNKTRELFQTFMPRRNEVENRTSMSEVYSLAIYPDIFSLDTFTPHVAFEKWVGVEVDPPGQVPEGMEVLEIPGGLYAIFVHVGPVTSFFETLTLIFRDWMPASGYETDNRPHFEILGPEYFGPMNPQSKEDVWIPIRSTS